MALDSGKIVQVNAFYFLVPVIVYVVLAFSYYSGSTDEKALWVPSAVATGLFLIMTGLGLTGGKRYATVTTKST